MNQSISGISSKNRLSPHGEFLHSPTRLWHIALISGTILILELAFVRLIPAKVQAISYFINLIIVAGFFGLGTGCILEKKRDLSFALPLGLFLIFGFIYIFQGIVVYDKSWEVHYFLREAEIQGQAPRVPLFPAAAIIFVFASLPFMYLGQALARSMARFPRLAAYGWNIVGSIAGTVIFSLSSLFCVPPWIWPPTLMAIWAYIFLRKPISRFAYLVTGLLFVLLAASPYESKWSPYYFVQYSQEKSGQQVWVNSNFHQIGINFKSTEKDHQELCAAMLKKWSRPYKWYTQLNQGLAPEKILILGAGTGNDVNVALINGAKQIVAVEVDPIILGLGKKFNTLAPYSDKRVITVVDDARHFLRTSKEKFDLIIFGTLDSQTLLRSQANLRLESYVYTAQALDDAQRLLADNGMAAIFCSVLKPWFADRIHATIEKSFGKNFRIYFEKDHALHNTLAVGVKDLDLSGLGLPAPVSKNKIAATDDWPFIYLERPTIAPVYLKLIGFILLLIIGVFIMLRKIHPVKGLHANFFFLGLGFALVESSAIVRLSLVSGATWTVNAVVFASMLVMIFAANALVARRKAPSLAQSWIFLSLSVLVNYWFALPWFFEANAVLRVTLAGILVGLPVFFAGVCFSHLFKKTESVGFCLGINLVGAMAGGVIEYLSMIFGMRAIWLIILAIYILAWALTPGLHGHLPEKQKSHQPHY